MALFKAPIPSTSYRDFRRPFLVFSFSSTTPRKALNRKNYLREKLLRTLTPPKPDSLVSKSPNKNPIVEIESPNEKFGVKLEEVEFPGTGELSVEESVGISDCNVGNIPEVSFFRIGLWLVGAFAFQTVCAIWMLGSANFDDKNVDTLSDEDKIGTLEIDSKEKDLSKNTEYLGDVRLQEKIEGIRMMAREVRQKEKMEIRKNRAESMDYDEEEDDFGKSGIEKEVRDRLIKLSNRLENQRVKLSMAMDNTTVKKPADRKHEARTNGLSMEDKNGDKSSGLIDKSNGFMNLNKYVKDVNVIKDNDGKNYTDQGISDSDGDVDPMNQAQKLDLQGVDSINLTMCLKDEKAREQAKKGPITSKTSGIKFKKKRERGTLGMKVGFGKSKPKGLKQDMKERSNENEASISGESSTIFGMSTISNVTNALIGNDYLRTDQSHSETELNKAGNQTGLWWLSLPYVLVIFMRRYGEGIQGLYTLRNSSETKGIVSYTVAFANREDASNFCYILETTFNNLEDFSADVVPITIKELDGLVKSDYTRVIVVKKGQLKLYAGQSLLEVEMALRSLVEQT